MTHRCELSATALCVLHHAKTVYTAVLLTFIRLIKSFSQLPLFHGGPGSLMYIVVGKKNRVKLFDQQTVITVTPRWKQNICRPFLFQCLGYFRAKVSVELRSRIQKHHDRAAKGSREKPRNCFFTLQRCLRDRASMKCCYWLFPLQRSINQKI